MNNDWLTHIKNSPVSKLNQHLFAPNNQKTKRKIRKDCKQVVFIREKLTYWCHVNELTLLNEYKFHEFRKFRFDFAIIELKIAIEYEGLNSEKSGHTTLKGYTNDTDKYNIAQGEGWKVLRFTVLNYKSVIQEIERQFPS